MSGNFRWLSRILTAFACLSFDLPLGLPAPTWPTRLGLIRSLSAETDVTLHSAAATSDLTQADAFRVHP